MIWSKLRKNVKFLIVPELRDRIDIHCTTYRKAHDLAGEEWITIDKIKVIGGGCCHWWKFIPKEILKRDPYFWGDEGFITCTTQSEEILEIQKKEIIGINHIWKSLENYLNTPINESLVSTNPIFKAFAVVDRRAGKRQIEKIQIGDNEHSLVKVFYYLRMSIYKKCISSEKSRQTSLI